MGDIGTHVKVIRIPKPMKAPVFPIKTPETSPVEAPAEPVKVPVRV